MNKMKIKKLVIELKGKDIELSVEQAKELQAALNELFEEKVRVVKEKEYIPQPYPVPRPCPVEPIYPWPWREPHYRCSAGTTLKLETNAVRFQLAK